MFRRGRPSAQQAYDLLRDGYINAADVPADIPSSYEGRVAYERICLSDQILDSVQEFMRQERISQQEIASRMSVSEGRVSQILSGDQNLTLKTLSSLAAALGGHFRVHFEGCDMSGGQVNPHPLASGPGVQNAMPRSVRGVGDRV